MTVPPVQTAEPTVVSPSSSTSDSESVKYRTESEFFANPPVLERSARKTRNRRPTYFVRGKAQFARTYVRAFCSCVYKLVVQSSMRTQEYSQLYALLLDPDFGLLESITPNVFAQCGHLLKANKKDPDTPSLQEALNGNHKEEFLEAMKTEIDELEAHKTWDVIPKSNVPQGANILPGTWAFRIKRFPDGRLRKFKARWCARGDKEIKGIDYDDVYSPVVSWSTVRLILTLATRLGWKSRQIDFSNAFVQATLDKDVYMHLPACFEPDSGAERGEVVLKLNKSIYGLRAAPQIYFHYLKSRLEKHGFRTSNEDPCLFIGHGMVILVYVDDCILLGPDLNVIDGVIKDLKNDNMPMTVEEGDVYSFLGIDMRLDSATGQISMTQAGLIKKVISTLGFDEYTNKKLTPASTTPLGTDADGEPFNEEWNYASVVGMLLYLSSNSRPDIQFAVHQCARFTHNPKKSHGEAIKRLDTIWLALKTKVWL